MNFICLLIMFHQWKYSEVTRLFNSSKNPRNKNQSSWSWMHQIHYKKIPSASSLLTAFKLVDFLTVFQREWSSSAVHHTCPSSSTCDGWEVASLVNKKSHRDDMGKVLICKSDNNLAGSKIKQKLMRHYRFIGCFLTSSMPCLVFIYLSGTKHGLNFKASMNIVMY